jgi:hypothetical protein
MKLFITKYKNSPVMAISLAVVVASVMVITTTLVFFNSSAYETVKQIQTGIKTSTELSDNLDTTSPIKASDIEVFYNSFINRLNSFDDHKDYGPDAISDKALGI